MNVIEKLFAEIKDDIPTLIFTNYTDLDGLECVNSKGGVYIERDHDDVYVVSTDYDSQYSYEADFESCVKEFQRVAAQ